MAKKERNEKIAKPGHLNSQKNKNEQNKQTLIAFKPAAVPVGRGSQTLRSNHRNRTCSAKPRLRHGEPQVPTTRCRLPPAARRCKEPRVLLLETLIGITNTVRIHVDAIPLHTTWFASLDLCYWLYIYIYIYIEIYKNNL